MSHFGHPFPGTKIMILNGDQGHLTYRASNLSWGTSLFRLSKRVKFRIHVHSNTCQKNGTVNGEGQDLETGYIIGLKTVCMIFMPTRTRTYSQSAPYLRHERNVGVYSLEEKDMLFIWLEIHKMGALLFPEVYTLRASSLFVCCLG
jgi:hypothetical protein